VDQQNVVRAVTGEPQLTRAGESPPVLLPPGSGSIERQRAMSPSRDPMRRLGAPCRLPTPLLEWRAEAARFHRLGRTSRRRERLGSVVRMRSFSTQFGAWPGRGVAVAPRFPPSAPRLVEILAFPSVQLLYVAGPLQVFPTANEIALSGSKGGAPYLLSVVAPGGASVTPPLRCVEAKEHFPPQAGSRRG
jgi:hypothetical protein